MIDDQKVAEMKQKYNEKSKEEKKKLIIFMALIAIIAFFVIAFCVGFFIQTISFGKHGTGILNALKLGTINYFVATICIYGVLILFILYALFKQSRMNQIEYTKDGINYAKNKVAGEEHWMTEQEKKEAFKISPVEETNETLYGSNIKGGGSESVVSYKKPNGPEGNRNTLVICTPGGGKTYTYVMNELIQTILRGHSFIVSDPKGECYRDTAQFCKDMGVDVKLLDMRAGDIKYSDCWNCLHECINPATERIDSSRLTSFVNIYLQNSGKGKQDFWYDCAVNLITLVISFVAFEHEKEVVEGLVDLYKKITGKDNEDPLVKDMTNTFYPIKEMKDNIREEAFRNGYNLEEIKELIRFIEKEKPTYKFTIEEVYDSLLHFDTPKKDENGDVIVESTAKLVNQPLVGLSSCEWFPGSDAYLIFIQNNSDSVRQSALQGSQLRFGLLRDATLRKVLSNDGIKITDINRKPCAYYIITDDKDDTFKPVVSLFFSFFFKDTMDAYDAMDDVCGQKGIKNPCIPVTAMLEEFFSIGVIGGDPNVFAKTMSTCRSRKLYVSIIIQNYSQIEALYGPFIKDTIQTCCSTMYFLGANDEATIQFVSNYIGDTTILDESHNEIDGASLQTTRDMSVKAIKKTLVSKEKLRNWKAKVLLVKQGFPPTELYPFPWTNNPRTVIMCDVDEEGNVIERHEKKTETDIENKVLVSSETFHCIGRSSSRVQDNGDVKLRIGQKRLDDEREFQEYCERKGLFEIDKQSYKFLSHDTKGQYISSIIDALEPTEEIYEDTEMDRTQVLDPIEEERYSGTNIEHEDAKKYSMGQNYVRPEMVESDKKEESSDNQTKDNSEASEDGVVQVEGIVEVEAVEVVTAEAEPQEVEVVEENQSEQQEQSKEDTSKNAVPSEKETHQEEQKEKRTEPKTIDDPENNTKNSVVYKETKNGYSQGTIDFGDATSNLEASANTLVDAPKKTRGRPKGSKNKPKPAVANSERE